MCNEKNWPDKKVQPHNSDLTFVLSEEYEPMLPDFCCWATTLKLGLEFCNTSYVQKKLKYKTQ